MRPPIRLPMKIVPIATSNGSTASALLQPNWSCKGLLKTLQAYTAPRASCTRTAAMTIHHRPRVGSRSTVRSEVDELAVAMSASLGDQGPAAAGPCWVLAVAVSARSPPVDQSFALRHLRAYPHRSFRIARPATPSPA